MTKAIINKKGGNNGNQQNKGNQQNNQQNKVLPNIKAIESKTDKKVEINESNKFPRRAIQDADIFQDLIQRQDASKSNHAKKALIKDKFGKVVLQALPTELRNQDIIQKEIQRQEGRKETPINQKKPVKVDFDLLQKKKLKSPEIIKGISTADVIKKKPSFDILDFIAELRKLDNGENNQNFNTNTDFLNKIGEPKQVDVNDPNIVPFNVFKTQGKMRKTPVDFMPIKKTPEIIKEKKSTPIKNKSFKQNAEIVPVNTKFEVVKRRGVPTSTPLPVNFQNKEIQVQPASTPVGTSPIKTLKEKKTRTGESSKRKVDKEAEEFNKSMGCLDLKQMKKSPAKDVKEQLTKIKSLKKPNCDFKNQDNKKKPFDGPQKKPFNNKKFKPRN